MPRKRPQREDEDKQETDTPEEKPSGLFVFIKCHLYIDRHRWQLYMVRVLINSEVGLPNLLLCQCNGKEVRVEFPDTWKFAFGRDRMFLEAEPSAMMELEIKLGEPMERNVIDGSEPIKPIADDKQ